MKKEIIFKGAATALVTPMKDDYSVNYEQFEKLVEFQISEGVDALVLTGTTGEAPTLKIDEHLKVIERAIKVADGRVKIIAGTGSNDTFHSVETSKSAKHIGADAILSVAPYYNKSSQAGLIKHFNYIADHVDIPMILYNVPSRTGSDIKPETCVELAKHKNIVAIKEASGNLSAVAKIAAWCKDDLQIYSGNDDQIVPILSLGGIGVISVLSNIAPKITHDICQKYFDGNVDESKNLQLKYLDLINCLFADVNPIMVKDAMNIMGLGAGTLRLPLVPPSNENHLKMIEELKKINLI